MISQSSPWVWDHGENYHPLIFTCKLPQDVSKSNYTGLKSENIPNSVSLVMDKCDTATNNMKIIYDVPLVQHDFGICFKMLDFPMTRISKPLVEMIELLKILGVGGIHFPYLAVDNETMKVRISIVDKYLDAHVHRKYAVQRLLKNFCESGFEIL